MTTYIVPLSAEAQKFKIDLAGTTYSLKLQWCGPNNTWILDISTEAEVPILTSIPLVANVDLLEPYGYLNLGGKLIAQTDNDADLPPAYENLGISSQLYFITP